MKHLIGIGTVEIVHQASDGMRNIPKCAIYIDNMSTIIKWDIIQFGDFSLDVVQWKPFVEFVIFSDENDVTVWKLLEIIAFFKERPVDHAAVEPCAADTGSTVCTLNLNVNDAPLSVFGTDIELQGTLRCTFILDLCSGRLDF